MVKHADEAPPPRVVPRHISGIAVIFDFGHGHTDRRGKFSGNYSQSDVVDQYARRFVEELETDNVRMFHVETRRVPGTQQDQRLDVCPQSYVPLILSCDHTDRPGLHNKSTIEYCGPYLDIAQRIGEGLGEWGRCYVWGHKVSKPVSMPGDKPYIRVSPFALGGPHEDDYLKRLDQLGISLGRAVAQYLIARKEGRQLGVSTLRG